MNSLRSLRRRLRLLLLGLTALLLAWLAPPGAALAHRLDEYLQATYITVAPTQIVVELNLSPGALVAPQVLAQLDPDGDQHISDAEGQAYVDSVLRQVALHVDGQPLALTITRIEMPPHLNLQAGYGQIRIFTTATLAAGMTGTHSLYYKNNNAPTGVIYQVNAFVDKDVAITLGKQNRDAIQQSMSVDYSIGSAATTETVSMDTPTETAAGASDQARNLLAYLYEPALSPWLLVVALGLSVLLGGLHALTPGHGKTLVAAYLVGSRGTAWHAVFLGGIVTFTHTASVIAVGLLALLASQFIVPSVLLPALEIGSGLLVVALGVRLVWTRWLARGSDEPHDHPHPHPHRGSGGVRRGDLLALGVIGGLIPCPEALGILLVAIGLNRVALGLGLIVAFSLGLAAVLILMGILLVRSQAVVSRLGGLDRRWQRLVPLASAVVVTLLGAGIMLKGLMTYV